MALVADQMTVGQKWPYVLTFHYTAKDIDITEEESFNVEVTAVRNESATIQVSQLLTASIVDGQRFPTDTKAVPARHEWALFPNGAVAFMPEGRFGLENRLFRVLKAILPEPKGDPSREKSWTVDYPDDGKGMPIGALSARFVKSIKDDREYQFSYREMKGTDAFGRFVRKAKSPFPSLIEAKFTRTQMQGGTDIVDCDFTMKLVMKS